MIVADTGALFSALDRSQPASAAVRDFLESVPDRLVLSPFVLAELDYLVHTRIGVDAELQVLDDVVQGAYELASFDDGDLAAARDVVAAYRDLGIGLADASVVVLADRHGTDCVLTLDERHFRALRTLDGKKPFRLVPADA